MTEACSQVTTTARRCPARACAGRRTARSWSPARPSARAAAASWPPGDLGAFDGRRRAADPRPQGRHDHLAAGENVAPAEVEAVLEAHPRWPRRPCTRAAGPGVGRGDRRDSSSRDGAARQSRTSSTGCCADRLARFKVPKAFAFAAFLPRTPSGKLLRGSLR